LPFLGLLKIPVIFSLINNVYDLKLRAVKRINNPEDANNFLRSLELKNPESKKYILLDCDANTVKNIIIGHVRDIYMGKRNFHFLITSLVSF